jgi:hypothetical protein
VVPVVQGLPSSQDVVSGLLRVAQVPVCWLQKPSVHWVSRAEQSTGVPGCHVPLLQVSPTVQGFPSSHVVTPFITAGFGMVVHWAFPLLLTTQARTRHGASGPVGP